MTPYEIEKRHAAERDAYREGASRSALARLERHGSPYRRRTDPLRRKGAIPSPDPGDALLKHLKPYHGEERPR